MQVAGGTYLTVMMREVERERERTKGAVVKKGMRCTAAVAVIVVVVVQVGMVHTPPQHRHTPIHTHTRTWATPTPDTDGIRRASLGSRGGGGEEVPGEEHTLSSVQSRVTPRFLR